jgi:hypothetical protein
MSLSFEVDPLSLPGRMGGSKPMPNTLQGLQFTVLAKESVEILQLIARFETKFFYTVWAKTVANAWKKLAVGTDQENGERVVCIPFDSSLKLPAGTRCEILVCKTHARSDMGLMVWNSTPAASLENSDLRINAGSCLEIDIISESEDSAYEDDDGYIQDYGDILQQPPKVVALGEFGTSFLNGSLIYQPLPNIVVTVDIAFGDDEIAAVTATMMDGKLVQLSLDESLTLDELHRSVAGELMTSACLIKLVSPDGTLLPRSDESIVEYSIASGKLNQ